jgi:FlaA1/EpsC-like NDP-sugar epimerase
MKKKLALIFVDILLISISYIAAYVLRLDIGGIFIYSDVIKTSLPVIVVVTLLVFIRMGMYNAVWRYASVDSFIMVLKAVTTSTSISVALIFFVQMQYRTPRSIFIIYWMLLLIGMGGLRFSTRLYRYYYALRGKRGDSQRRVLIYGAGPAGQMVAKEMRYDHTLGYHPVCFVDDDSTKVGKSIHSLPIYSGSSRLSELIERNNINDVLIAIPSTSGEKVRDIIDGCKLSKIKFKTLPSMSDIVDGEVSVNQIRDVVIDDLLKRSPKDLDMQRIKSFVAGKSILITGAAGSIGSELSRQVAQCRPSVIMLADNNEYGLYKIDTELNDKYNDVEHHAILENTIKSVNIEDHLRRIKTDIVFHSAAYKHVPLVETNPCEAIINNILGAVKVGRLATKYKVNTFVMVSTDKAVRPTGVMGATKRVCELYIQNINRTSDTNFVAVRFGNVLDSSGSVVPKFRQQIRNGGPVTVTHPDITRYFMLIPEAVQLVMQAASLGKGGEIFILDMGKPVKILDMAKDMIIMMGCNPNEVKIEYSGLRVGEKLHEELAIDKAEKDTRYESIAIADSTKMKWEEFESNLDRLIHFASEGNVGESIRMLKTIVPEYNPQNEIYKAILETTQDTP